MDNRSPKVLRFSAWTLRVKRHNLFQVANKWTMSLFCEEYCQCCTAPCKQYCRQCCSAVNVYQCMFSPAPTRVNNCFWFVNALKGNYHELRMHLSEVVSGNMPGFMATFRSRNLLFCQVISFAAKDPSYASGFALHRCRLESNLKSSGCLFQVKLLMTVSL